MSGTTGDPKALDDGQLVDDLAELAIRNLVRRYNRCLDDRRLPELVALFAEDGEMHSLGQVVRGHEELSAFFQSDQLPPLTRPVTAHHVTNLLIEVDGDTAEAESDFLVVRRNPEGAFEFMVCGRYTDVMTRTPDGWRFARRQALALGRARD
jgi:3-phenylpropionate/cinnamic acid dioxygenase small subunit